MYRQRSKAHRVTGATEQSYITHLLAVLDHAHRELDRRGVPPAHHIPKEITCVRLVVLPTQR